MSPSWRDQIRISLLPHQVTLTRVRRGWTPRIDMQRVLPCTAVQPGAVPWQATLAALAEALPEFTARRGDVEVILSNHFVRYVLISHSDQISSAAEEQALVRHRFVRTYGGGAENWVLRLSDIGAHAGLRLASAVDAGLLESLSTLFRPGRLILRSIQPYLMAAFNRWRPHLAGDAWFALIEPGRLCLAQLQDNQWRTLKTIKVSDTWLPELLTLLDRERLLAGVDSAASAPVYVFAPGCAEISAAQAREHAIQLLLPSDATGATDSARATLAMDVTG